MHRPPPERARPDLGAICVEGSLDGMVNGLVTAEAHGKYLEGTGCVKPVGGH
ncbi:hypothetical protein ACH4CE_16455 [Streptomyces gelaticus]|uniref:hypothetical protein n=1 Tax=Streptomyces gelaticus TaxID=285446 RepID=UPI0037BCE9C4